MTYAVSCHECDETVYPPHEAEGSGGRSEIAALRLALEHAQDTDHTEVYIIPGCYWVGDGPRPEGFGDDVDADDYITPARGKLADDLDSAVETLRSAADRLADADPQDADHAKLYLDRQADRLRDWAELLERKQREREDGDHDV